MTTLNEDLATAQRQATDLAPDVDNEIVGSDLYLNYAYHEAVVITPEITPVGRVWHAVATGWDRTGGVSAEKFLWTGTLTMALAAAIDHIEIERWHERKLEKLLEGRPDE